MVASAHSSDASAQKAHGSGYLLPPLDRSARSELLHMMGLVAAVVAIVILVFFGLGYLFGRLFL